MAEISISIENKYFGGDCSISPSRHTLMHIFQKKTVLLLASVRENAFFNTAGKNSINQFTHIPIIGH